MNYLAIGAGVVVGGLAVVALIHSVIVERAHRREERGR